jgi:hypothetical protein
VGLENNNDGTNTLQSNLLTNGYSVNNITDDLQQLSKCNIYTFESLYTSDIFKPSINNLSRSLNLDYSHIENDVLCLYEDQVPGLQKFHTCEKNNCLTTDGNNISPGISEIYFTSCETNLPTCDGGFYSISLNFSQTDNTGIINSATRCLSVQDIIVPSEAYNVLSQFYKDSGIFTVDSNLSSGVSYYNCTITNDLCDTNSVRQKFRVSRYTYDGSNMVSDDNGFFAEILFRPLNLVLSINEENNDIIFRPKITNDPEINWLLAPPLDLSPSKITNISRYQLSKQFTLQNPELLNLMANRKISQKGSGIPLSPLVPSQGLEILDQSYSWPEPETCYSLGLTDSDKLNLDLKWTDTWTWETIIDAISTINIEELTYKYVSLGGVKVNDNNTFYRTILTDIFEGDEINFEQNYIVGISALGSDNVNQYSALIPTDNILIDNEVAWRRAPAFEDVIIFPETYFTSKNVNNFPFKLQEIPEGNFYVGSNVAPTPKVVYPVRKTGLLNLIDYSKSTYTNNVNVDSPLSFTINTSDIGVGGTGKFILNLDKNKDKDKVIITSYNIIDPGVGCNDVTVNLSLENGISISGVKFSTKLEDMIYTAVPVVNTGGLILDNVVLKNSGEEIASAKGVSGGFGYQTGQDIYIVQIDSFGNILTENLDSTTLGELINNQSDYAKLNYIKVTESMLNTTPVPFSTSVNPNNLLINNSINTEINIKPDSYEYFKVDDNDQLFKKSPPQIIYMDSTTLNEAQKLLKNTTNPSALESFFYNSSPGIYPPYTTIDYFKSLQYTSLNYSTVKDSNNLSQFEDLVLGRFIPYSSFTYVQENQNGTRGNVTLYNSNYTQLIPYGIQKIYESTLTSLDLPTL